VTGLAHFWRTFYKRPVRALLTLSVEYLTYIAAVFLALGLWVTRAPLTFLDRTLGLALRQRFVDFIARVSPG
jgi:hypothetical protein